MRTGTTPRTVDEYLALVDPVKRAALQKLRKTIRAVMPKAEECISYGMPGFRLDGRMVVWFAAATRHCAFYPGGIVRVFERELSGFGTSKGTIRFGPEQPLPAGLIRKIVKARMAQNAAKGGSARKVVRRRRTLA
jgi:uncharacterized protein YdhG (YjbR/CyaY superfamily)